MQFRAQIVAIVTSLSLLILVLRLVYQRRLREEHALLWLLAASSILGLSVLGGTLTRVAHFLQIGYPPSLLFAAGGVFVLLILLSQTLAISSLACKNRDLAQKIAMLEWHLKRPGASKWAEPGRGSDSITRKDSSQEALMPVEERR